MTIESMTGFGRDSGSSGPWRLAVEIRSVNGKSLDVKLRLAPPVEDMQDALRRLIADAVKRGSVTATLTLQNENPAGMVRLDEARLAGLYKSVCEAAARLGADKPGLDAVLGLRGVVDVAETTPEAAELDALREAVMHAFSRALAGLAESRKREGASLAQVLGTRLSEIEALARRADVAPGRQPAAVGQRLAETIRSLVEASPALDPQRLHQEALIMAAKADIREELDRLHAHVAAGRELLGQGGAIGRRLDFLAQEFGRECNTVCSKSPDMDLTRIGLELKSVVDQLREQVQNVA
jgi:uncharacterized protein (TIGR00255 family)